MSKNISNKAKYIVAISMNFCQPNDIIALGLVEHISADGSFVQNFNEVIHTLWLTGTAI